MTFQVCGFKQAKSRKKAFSKFLNLLDKSFLRMIIKAYKIKVIAHPTNLHIHVLAIEVKKIAFTKD